MNDKTMIWQPGRLVRLRDREWVVLPSDDVNWLLVKPLGGTEAEITAIYLPLPIAAPTEKPVETFFPKPTTADLGDITTARFLYDSARLAFRNGAGPFRCLAKLSFRPRSYQIVPLVMALRQEQVRLLIADDVGVGKTIEALLILRELLERRKIKRFAIVCLPHLCEQWQEEIRQKLDIEAVIIRSNTQASLDRQIQGDTSVYEYYPYQIISIDYIKSDSRRNIFVAQCPEFVVVDEAHSCARPSGASRAQQQRHHLVSEIAAKPGQHLLLLTATPHSGKPEEFHSLLGLLRPGFATLDIPSATASQRRELAGYVVIRKRADVQKWLKDETPFPGRDTTEWPYPLSPNYATFFENILRFSRQLLAQPHNAPARIQYWTALALLRGVMSSPAAGLEMLNTRLAGHPAPLTDDNEELTSPVHDLDFGFEGDTTPLQLVEHQQWSDNQKQQLRRFAATLNQLANLQDDQKLASAELILEKWLSAGFQPVVFCRYIATAHYLGQNLKPTLGKQFSELEIQIITSELPDDERKQRIADMGKAPKRLLIATDCLSEGINLQQQFTAVLHYDLPWNPNRLEQREGRVDRFGQTAPLVKTCLLYGEDNPIDGIVLEVLLRKVREIKRATGITVPFPENSQSIIDTITQALLLHPDRQIRKQKSQNQLTLNFSDFPEANTAKNNITRKLEEAAEREKTSRSIFAQHAIKAHEIETDLEIADEAIGDPEAVEMFVSQCLRDIFGIQIDPQQKGYRLVTANLPSSLTVNLPKADSLKISFHSPTPEGYLYLGRNHPFVEQLCQMLMTNTLDRQDKHAGRAAVIRTSQVTIKTTLFLCRCRNVIEQKRGDHQIIAEEMVLWGWQGSPADKRLLGHAEAKALLIAARPTANLSPQTQANFLENELQLLELFPEMFNGIAEQRSQELVKAHERFSSLLQPKQFQVVYPVLPMDILGIYILLPQK